MKGAQFIAYKRRNLIVYLNILNEMIPFLLDEIKFIYLNSFLDINHKYLEVVLEKIFKFVKVNKNVADL